MVSSCNIFLDYFFKYFFVTMLSLLFLSKHQRTLEIIHFGIFGRNKILTEIFQGGTFLPKEIFYFKVSWTWQLLFSFSFFFSRNKNGRENKYLFYVSSWRPVIYSHKQIYLTSCRGPRSAFDFYIHHFCSLKFSKV